MASDKKTKKGTSFSSASPTAKKVTTASKIKKKSSTSKTVPSLKKAASAAKNTASKGASAAKSTVSKSAAPEKAKMSPKAKKAANSQNAKLKAVKAKKASARSSSFSAARGQMAEPKKNHKVMMISIIAAAAVLAVVIGLYAYKASYFKDHFYTGTVINGVDCSEFTLEEACAVLQENIDQRTFTVNDDEGRSYTVTAPEINMTYADNGEVENLLNAQNILLWPFEQKDSGTYLVAEGYTYDQDAFRSWLDGIDCVNDGAAPTDATYSVGENGYYVLVKEKEGDLIDFETLYNYAANALTSGETSVQVSDANCYVHPTVYSDDTELNTTIETHNKQVDHQLLLASMAATQISFFTFKDDEPLTLGSDVIMSFIDDGDTPTFNKERVLAWTQNWAAERDLSSYSNLFTTHAGKLVNCPNGYRSGWTLDVEKTADALYDALTSKTSGTVHPAVISDGLYLTETTYVEISITEQTMWCYVDGKEMIETPVVTGLVTQSDRSTPSDGVWYITAKMRDHTMYGQPDESGNYSYIAFCEYWLPFNDTIGIHDLASRDEFGGDIYKTDGSHGCINTPLDAVKQIYDWVSVGTSVVVYTLPE